MEEVVNNVVRLPGQFSASILNWSGLYDNLMIRDPLYAAHLKRVRFLSYPEKAGWEMAC